MFKLVASAKGHPMIAVADSFYSDEELRSVWAELAFLTHPRKMHRPEETGTATDASNAPLKRNKSIYLDVAYSDRNVSDLLCINRKIMTPAITEELEALDPLFKYVRLSTLDSTLLSYYEDGDSYRAHADTAAITVLSYFIKDPTKVSGGELYFPEFDLTIVPENNMVVAMPSCYMHEVKTVSHTGVPYDTFGRYCMAQLLCCSS